MELTFIEEEIPKINRAGGSGREAEKWEDHIAPLKAEDRAGKSFRVWTYDKRPSAVSRMSSVRERLTQAVPSENWQLAVRPVPGTEDAVHPEGATTTIKEDDGTESTVSIAGQSATQYGVYVAYQGTFTDEEVAKNAADHKARSDRVKAARAAAQAKAAKGNGNAEATTPESGVTAEAPESEQTAKERVAAARKAQKVS